MGLVRQVDSNRPLNDVWHDVEEIFYGHNLAERPVIYARWIVLCKFGRKDEAMEALRTWLVEVGWVGTGATPDRTRLVTASVGEVEARCEVELQFGNMSELDHFFDEIKKNPLHGPWGKAIGNAIVDGTSKWEIYRGLSKF